MASPFRKNDALVDGLIRRDRNAIDYFFRRYFYGLKLFVEMDEDVAMEAIEISLEKIHEYNPLKSKFITWVYRIARNLFLKKRRSDEKVAIVYAEELLNNYDEEDTGGSEREEWVGPNSHTNEFYSNFFQEKFIDAEFKHQIDRAVKMLSPEERQVLKNYCERKKQKYSLDKRKTVFKKLRSNLRAIQEAEGYE